MACAAETPISPTPILDRLAPLPQPTARGSGGAFSLAALVGLGIAIPALLGYCQPSGMRPARRWLLSILVPMLRGPWTAIDVALAPLVVIGMIAAVIAIHELGHALAGMCAGFRIRSLRVGPLLVDRPFRISRYRGPGAWIRGEVIMDPIKTDHLVPRALAMVLAGPAANLLSGTVVLLLPVPLSLYTGFFIADSLVAGVVELFLPHRSRTVVFDGARIWMLLFDRPRGERWLALMMKLGAELRDGVPPESLSPDFLAKAVAIRDDSRETVAAHAIAFTATIHQHRDHDAAQALETCLLHSGAAPPALREALMTDAAIFQARRRQRVDLAEAWRADLPEVSSVPGRAAKIEAAIREAKGDLAGALDKLAEAEQSILAVSDEARRSISLRVLGRWQSEVRQRLRARAALATTDGEPRSIATIGEAR